MGYYKYVKELYRGIRKKSKLKENKELKQLLTERKKEWKVSAPVERVEKPTRIDKARHYGYKSKQGFVIARVRIRKGGMRKSRPTSGRGPKRMGVNKITPEKSIQRIAEERAQKRYPNLEVLGSYWLWEDGQSKWYEIVMVDKHHPSIMSDKDVNWICQKQHTGRVYRGLTPAGRKGRGLFRKGVGTEKLRPSVKSHHRQGK